MMVMKMMLMVIDDGDDDDRGNGNDVYGEYNVVHVDAYAEMKMPLMQGTNSEARLSRRQMIMIANSRYSGSLSILHQHDLSCYSMICLT